MKFQQTPPIYENILVHRPTLGKNAIENIIGYTTQDVKNLHSLAKQLKKTLFSGFRGSEKVFKQ